MLGVATRIVKEDAVFGGLEKTLGPHLSYPGLNEWGKGTETEYGVLLCAPYGLQ